MKITKRTQFQNGGSKFKSGLSVNSAAFAFAKRTQFSPDIPQGGDSLSPPALCGTGDPSAGTEQDRLFSNLPFASNRLPAGGFGRPAQNAALACRIPRISEFWLRASAFPLYSAIRTPNSTLKESNLIQPNPTKTFLRPCPCQLFRTPPCPPEPGGGGRPGEGGTPNSALRIWKSDQVRPSQAFEIMNRSQNGKICRLPHPLACNSRQWRVDASKNRPGFGTSGSGRLWTSNRWISDLYRNLFPPLSVHIRLDS